MPPKGYKATKPNRKMAPLHVTAVPKEKIGRPTIKTPELIEELCIRVASGRSITSVADDDDMPTEATIYNWRIQDVAFFEKLSRAQEIRKEATRHKMIALADRVLTDDKLDHQRAAVAGALGSRPSKYPRHANA